MSEKYTISNTILFSSIHLKRNVSLRLVSKGEVLKDQEVLILNDGQDLEALDFLNGINQIQSEINDLLVVAVHCNEDRLQEYGTAHKADYKKRGSKAKLHSSFITKELVPYLKKLYPLENANFYMAGFSLGGLSALDIAYHNSDVFSKIGVFSGSFWWRTKAYEKGFSEENDRIMHVRVREIPKPLNPLKMWFECGTDDEKEDRNGNGIIDSIDDTQDLITELVKKGFELNKDIFYHEVPNGQHNPATWGAAMPYFLKWLSPRTL